MRISKQLPKQGDFWERYAGLVPTLNKLSYLTQLISFLSEISVFYLLIKPKVNEVAPMYAHGIAIAGALIVALTVEIGVRNFFPYTVKTILHRRWGGLDLPMSLFIWAFTLGLFGVSLFTSFQGSHDVVYDAMTTGKSRDKIDQTFTSEKEAILGRYSADSLQTAQTYDGQIIALQDAGSAAVSAKREQLRSIEKREAATNQSFLSQKSKLREQIAATQAETAAKVADLQTKKADALALLMSKRETNEGEAKELASGGVATLESKGTKYSGWVAWFTIICHVFLAIAITMNEIVKKGSQIDEKPILGTFHFDPSVIAEWWGVVSNKYQVWARTRIRTWAEKTPDAPKPGALPVLYEHEPNQPRVVIGGFMPPNQPLNGGTAIITGSTDENRNNDTTFEDAFRVLENENFHSDLARLKAIIAASTDGNRIDENRLNENRNNDTTESSHLRACAHCQTTYTYKHHKQKYCSDDCRIAAWEGRTGRRFNPSNHHKKS